MASDDTEEPLPPKVQRALAEARKSADRARPDEPVPNTAGGRWLALIPISAAVLAFLLMMPRPVVPEDIPMPQIDGKAFDATVRDDDARAAGARTKRLDGDVLAVGTALRTLNLTLVKPGVLADDVATARLALREAAEALVRPDPKRGFDSLRTLRAVQLEAFLAEVSRFESSGKRTEELDALGGGFVDRLTAAGWIEGQHVVLDDAQRRVAFKLAWAATLSSEREPALQLSLDEQRVLYILYLAHPHAPEGERLSFAGMRAKADNVVDCQKTVAKETAVVEKWRADKIRRFGEIDPSYPTGYALGVSYYRAGRYDLSMEQFRNWVATHPDGPYSLRARNHLKAAFSAFGPS